MNIKYRLLLMLLSFIMMVTLGALSTKGFGFLIKDFWFTSGALMLILLSLVDQPFFSKDSNIFVNGVTALISILLVPISNRDWLYWLFFGVILYLIISSYALMLLRQRKTSDETPLIQLLSRLNREIGKPEALFSALFLWGVIQQFQVSSTGFNALLLFWIIFMILNIPSVAKAIHVFFTSKGREDQDKSVGEIFGVQSKNTFLVKLHPDRKESLRLFEFVCFIYSADDFTTSRKGMILDTYLLNSQQWVKILISPEIEEHLRQIEVPDNLQEDLVYKLQCNTEDSLPRFVGIVSEESKIGKIRFNYNSKFEVSEGALLEVRIQGKTVLYQIIEATASIEVLEQKNEASMVIGEAIQLGTWNSDSAEFESYGWVPSVNTPIYLAKEISDVPLSGGDLIIGEVPRSNYPVILDKKTALSHHTAILGVTGTGKSVFARNLMREYLKEDDIKMICVDFTGEHKKRFSDLPTHQIISEQNTGRIYTAFEWITNELEKFPNQQNKAELKKKEDAIKGCINDSIEAFLKSETNLSILELPDLDNTTNVFKYLRYFFLVLFLKAKEEDLGKRICIVLEEAHTIIPEWNSVGMTDKSAQAVLNSIAQIALQGRKYDIGLIVIAQRTANVSKTILTQCNTIVSFQQFDKTSSDFLANYFGQGLEKSIQKLQPRHAIVSGKALKSRAALIFKVPDIKETTQK